MLDYQQLTGCRLEFLRRHLDDPGAEPCGRCDNCTGTPVHSGTDAEAVAAARVALRSGTHVIEPRKRWPSGVSGRLLPAEPGRALAFAADDGWGGLVRAALAAPGDPVGEELAKGIFDVLRAWDWAERPSWVTWVPEGRGLPRRIAECIATAGRLDLVESVTRIATRPPQDDMENSVTQVRNVIGAFEVHDVPPGTGLLVDDTMRSGWTLAVVAHQLREAGAGRILPFVLWRKP
jgi:ATP-dependent DNA helicase RecQ